MTDYYDQSQETEAMFLEQAKQAQAVKAASTAKPKPTGSCQNPLCCIDFERDSQKLFCGPDCATDYHKYTKR